MRLRPIGIADKVRSVRARVTVCAAVTVRDIERQPALNDGRLTQLPAAEPDVAPHEGQLVGRRDAEVVFAVPVGRTVFEVRIREELVAAVLAFPLQGVLRENRIPAREPFRQLRLQ